MGDEMTDLKAQIEKVREALKYSRVFDALDILATIEHGLPEMVTKQQIMSHAMMSGIAISTAYGQRIDKLCPISDPQTLIEFAKNLGIRIVPEKGE